MDLWIALAAAGASYVVKNWKNFLRDREISSEFPSGDSKFVKPVSPSSMGHRRHKSCPFQRLAQRKSPDRDGFTEREQPAESASSQEVASTSGFDGEKLVNLDNYEDCNVLSTSSLSPRYLRNENFQVVEEGLVNGNMGENFHDSFPEPSMTEVGTSYGFTRNKSSLRIRQSNMQFIKPLTSLESCLIAQLYKDHAEMAEYVVSSVPSPSSATMRPFIVTDGRRIISRRWDDSFNLQIETGKSKLHKLVCSAEDETVFGIPPLPYNGSLELPKLKVKTGGALGGKLSSSSKMVNGKHFHLLTGSSHGALLFGFGVSVGLLSSFIAKKREVDKLNDLLRQTENLVQDLQDELEMKDSLTVKELAMEDDESQDKCFCSYDKRAPPPFSSEHNLDGSTKCDGKELLDRKAEEDSESMSKIEAELVAELERLELNMNSSSLEGKFSDLVKLDPDFNLGITQDELRPDIFVRQADDQPYADQDGSGSSTPHPANYSVSPRALTLRLHEVIQSRLEERVKELEAALENSQRKIRSMEVERNIYRSDIELRSPAYQRSPIAAEERNSIDQPLVIKLSGEALDAYNEAYDELAKMDESEEAGLASGGDEKGLPIFDQNGVLNHYQPNYTTTDDKASPALIPGDESGDNDDDEMEKLLIKQIVEKTRKGSVILNAQKGLFSVGEYEH